MSEKPELKPCPFCGGDPEIMTSPDGFTSIGCLGCNPVFGVMVQRMTRKEAVEAWNTRPATTIGQVAVEVVPTERTCKLEPLKAFEVTVNMLDQTEWGVCSNCGTASPIDATYCCECGAKVIGD